MKRLHWTFTTLLSAGFLVGCTPTTMDPVTIEPSYKVIDLWWAGKDNGIPLSVSGTPYGMNSDEAAAAFAGDMRVPGYAPQVDIRPRTPEDGLGGWSMVLAFDAPQGASASNVCSTTRGHSLDSTTTAGESPRTLFAAFCRNGSRVTSTRASLPGDITGAEDSRLQRILQQVSRALFPRHNPHLDDRDNQGNDWNS